MISTLMLGSSRIREFRLSLNAVLGGSALTSLFICLLLYVAGTDIGISLAIVGLVLAVLIPGGIEVRQRAGRPRKVLILDYRAHQFGHAVAREAIKLLHADKRQWYVEHKRPNPGHGGVQWQIDAINHAIVDELDGIILVPGADDERLWLTLAAAIKAGIFIVAVDTKPPNRVFRDLGLAPPRFVSSKYNETGLIIGSALNVWLESDPKRRCVLWIGPIGSWPGEERSRNVLFELAMANHLGRTTLYPIDSWIPNRQRCRDTLEIVRHATGEVAVYCADDENALALHLLTLTEEPDLRRRIFVVGCNATPDDWGEVQAIGMHAVDLTVDVLAEQQGAQAARLLINERAGRLNASERSVFIPPKPRPRVSSPDRWLDTLLDEELGTSPLPEQSDDGGAEVELALLADKGTQTYSADPIADGDEPRSGIQKERL